MVDGPHRTGDNVASKDWQFRKVLQYKSAQTIVWENDRSRDRKRMLQTWETDDLLVLSMNSLLFHSVTKDSDSDIIYACALWVTLYVNKCGSNS